MRMQSDTPRTDHVIKEMHEQDLGWDRLHEFAKELEREISDGRATCWWSLDGDEEGPYENAMFATQCGHYFKIDSGQPSDNEMAYCCFCGKPISEDREDDLW